MKDKILNVIMVILLVLLFVIAGFKTTPKEFQNQVHSIINQLKNQIIQNIPASNTPNIEPQNLPENISKPAQNIDEKFQKPIEKTQHIAQKSQTNSAEPDFGPYMRELQRSIKQNWNPPKGNSSRRIVVLFKVAKDGKLLALKIYKSSGNIMADRAALKAVETTAPFRPLPEKFKGKSVDIQFTFDYNVFNKRNNF